MILEDKTVIRVVDFDDVFNMFLARGAIGTSD